MFTTQPFSKGSYLLEYKGELVSAAEGSQREEFYSDKVGNFLFFFQDGNASFWWVVYYNIAIVLAKI